MQRAVETTAVRDIVTSSHVGPGLALWGGLFLESFLVGCVATDEGEL